MACKVVIVIGDSVVIFDEDSSVRLLYTDAKSSGSSLVSVKSVNVMMMDTQLT